MCMSTKLHERWHSLQAVRLVVLTDKYCTNYSIFFVIVVFLQRTCEITADCFNETQSCISGKCACLPSTVRDGLLCRFPGMYCS